MGHFACSAQALRRSHRLLLLAATVATLLAARAEDAPASAPTTDRVGFPTGYAEKFTVLRTTTDEKNAKQVTVYGNGPAASVTDRSALPYPNGSVLVMETASLKKDAAGKPVADAAGKFRKDQVLGLHVMRREAGFGEAYATNRTGEWEYVEYRADGTHLTPPSKSAACAACHVKAGKEKDFVFKARFAEEKK